MKRVVWVHTFNDKFMNSGVFMHQLFDQINKSQFTVEYYYIGNSIKDYIKSYLDLRRKIDKDTILHAQYGSLCGLFTGLFPCKKILTLRGSDWYISPSSSIKEYLHTRLAVFFTKQSLRYFDRVFVMSFRMKHEIWSKCKISSVLIPDGIDFKKFYPLDKISAFSELGLPPTTNPRILFATISKTNLIKRYPLAEKAVEIARKKIHKLELVLLHNIPHEKMNSFINTCDLILLTSTHEGFPNIIKEGLACNKPFLSTDVSDLEILSMIEPSCEVCEADAEVLSEKIIEKFSKHSKVNNLRACINYMEIQYITNKILSEYSNLIK